MKRRGGKVHHVVVRKIHTLFGRENASGELPGIKCCTGGNILQLHTFGYKAMPRREESSVAKGYLGYHARYCDVLKGLPPGMPVYLAAMGNVVPLEVTSNWSAY